MQLCCDIVLKGYNMVPTLQQCCAKNRVSNITWNRLVNLTDFSTTSLYHYYRKRIGTTSENLNFDIRVKKDNLKKGQKPGMQSTGGGRSGSHCPHPHKSLHFHAPATQAITYNPSSSILSLQVPYRPAVEVTSMSYLPNTQIEQYLGNINLFLIRESHTVREVTKIVDLPSCIFYRGRTREVYKCHVNCFSRLRVVPILPQG